MSRNYARRASDGRRSRWKQQAAQSARMADLYAVHGNLALKYERVKLEPPKPRIIFSLCDGLVSLIDERYDEDGALTGYVIRFGKQITQTPIVEFLRRWATFYAQFEAATGVNAAKQTTPVTNLLPAPKAPYGLLPAKV